MKVKDRMPYWEVTFSFSTLTEMLDFIKQVKTEIPDYNESSYFDKEEC